MLKTGRSKGQNYVWGFNIFYYFKILNLKLEKNRKNKDIFIKFNIFDITTEICLVSHDHITSNSKYIVDY